MLKSRELLEHGKILYMHYLYIYGYTTQGAYFGIMERSRAFMHIYTCMMTSGRRARIENTYLEQKIDEFLSGCHTHKVVHLHNKHSFSFNFDQYIHLAVNLHNIKLIGVALGYKHMKYKIYVAFDLIFLDPNMIKMKHCD